MSRRSSALTRQAIAESATRLFAAQGYAATSVRDIAASAGTDAALVIRHFGSKELLFLHSMHLDLDEHPVFDAPPEHLARHLVEFVVDLAEPERSVITALVGARSEPGVASRLLELHEEAFVAPLRARLDGPDADLRARTAAVLVAGLIYGLWVVADEGLLVRGRAELVDRFTALLQPLLQPLLAPAAPGAAAV